jgi:hypothetical protein
MHLPLVQQPLARGALARRRQSAAPAPPPHRAGGERYAGASSWIAGWLGWQQPASADATLANAPKPTDSEAIQKNIAEEADIKKLRTLAKALLQVGAWVVEGPGGRPAREGRVRV